MSRFTSGDRVRIDDLSGYILTKNQRKGTIITKYGGQYNNLYEVKIDNYRGDNLAFREINLSKIVNEERVTELRIFGIPIFSITKELF